MPREALLIAFGLLLAGSAAMAQDPGTSDNRIEAPQIETPAPESERQAPASKAYLESARSQTPAAPRASLTQPPSDTIARPVSDPATSQITSRSQSGASVAQLSKGELEATLAQLTPAERRVLLQAIEGTDICNNPPQGAAVIALCQSRIETRAREFAAMADPPLSAEEQLLRGDLENGGAPSISQVIDRLARTSAASDDFSNQAIASIALGAPPVPATDQPADGEPSDLQGLSEPTQSLINAIVNQLGGGGAP